MAVGTWDTIERPILEAVRQAELDRTEMGRAAFQAVPTLSDDAITGVIVSLKKAGYLEAAYVTTGGGDQLVDVGPLTERGRREVQQWPSDEPYTALIALIDQRLSESTGEEHTKYEQLKAALVAIGTGTGGTLLAQLIQNVAHLHGS